MRASAPSLYQCYDNMYVPSSTHQLPNACDLNEDYARCVKGLEGQGVDCEELETQEGCNASLYTGDTVPGQRGLVSSTSSAHYSHACTNVCWIRRL